MLGKGSHFSIPDSQCPYLLRSPCGNLVSLFIQRESHQLPPAQCHTPKHSQHRPVRLGAVEHDGIGEPTQILPLAEDTPPSSFSVEGDDTAVLAISNIQYIIGSTQNGFVRDEELPASNGSLPHL